MYLYPVLFNLVMVKIVREALNKAKVGRVELNTGKKDVSTGTT